MKKNRQSSRPVTPFDFGYDQDQGSPLDPTLPTYATVADYIAILEKQEGVEQSELDSIYPDPTLKERIILDALITATAFINARLAGCGFQVPIAGCQPILREVCVRYARRLREVYGIRENVQVDYDLLVEGVLDDVCAGVIVLPGATRLPVNQGDAHTPSYARSGQRCGYNPFWRSGRG